MADPRFRKEGPPELIRVESGTLLSPDSMASRIENFYPTEEGTLRSVVGPCLYQPEYPNTQVGVPPYVIHQSVTDYRRMHGIYHGLLQDGTRDTLLIHTGDQIWQHEGWNRGWRCLVEPRTFGASGALFNQDLPNKTRPCFPTQFERTPKGVVIVPQDGRALFFDGEIIAPLGYSEIPGAPVGLGPVTLQGVILQEVNGYAYAHDFMPRAAATGLSTAVNKDFRFGRIGSVRTEGDYPGVDFGGAAIQSRGVLDKGRWQAAIQWVDHWGNLSAISARSNSVVVSQEWTQDSSEGATLPTNVADGLGKFIAWSAVSTGRSATRGRVLYRTKDMNNSGTQVLFELSANAGGGTQAFATLSDNIAEVYPDNAPDSWLIEQARYTVPVPSFRLCKMSFGRLWVANTPSEPGILWPSEPGLYGTFMRNTEMFPDPRGAEITGMWSHDAGLLVFTESSTFIIVNNNEGTGFRTATVSSTIGCVAPNSIAAMVNGLVVWLGKEGFYGYNGKAIELVSIPIESTLRNINRARRVESVAVFDPYTKEYMCWLPLDGAQENSTCLVYDGQGWRRRSDVVARAACVTADHRDYVVVAGKAKGTTSRPTSGDLEAVWLLNHQNTSFVPDDRSASIETVWLTNSNSRFRKSPLTVFIWLRETGNFEGTAANDPFISVTVYRDWRKDPLYTEEVNAYPIDDVPPVWGTAVLGDAKWEKRRPFWLRASLFVPSCEVFMLKFSTTVPIDFLGFSIDTLPHDSGGARVPEGLK